MRCRTAEQDTWNSCNHLHSCQCSSSLYHRVVQHCAFEKITLLNDLWLNQIPQTNDDGSTMHSKGASIKTAVSTRLWKFILLARLLNTIGGKIKMQSRNKIVLNENYISSQDKFNHMCHERRLQNAKCCPRNSIRETSLCQLVRFSCREMLSKHRLYPATQSLFIYLKKC